MTAFFECCQKKPYIYTEQNWVHSKPLVCLMAADLINDHGDFLNNHCNKSYTIKLVTWLAPFTTTTSFGLDGQALLWLNFKTGSHHIQFFGRRITKSRCYTYGQETQNKARKEAPEKACLVENIVIIHHTTPISLQLLNPSFLRLCRLYISLFQIPGGSHQIQRHCF